MKKNIVLYKKIPQEQQHRLAQHFNVTAFDEVNEENYAEFIEALKTANGLIGSSLELPEKILKNAPHLEAISTISVGYDNFDLAYLNQQGIRLMNTPNVLTDTTADMLFMLVLMTARRAVELSSLVQDGKWKNSIGSEYYGTDVHHKTIGILGMGRIGQALAKRAFCGFDMPVLYMSNRPNKFVEQHYQAKHCSLDELLQLADIICITLPLTEKTEKLISREKLALMKKTAILVNGARGKIIDEAALIEALQNNQIKAAGLDVFEQEPLATTSPLLQLPNAVLLPHIGSATTETRLKMVECAVDNLIAALESEPPISNWVNPNVK
ncbi:NAD(P)-dependent oxidoreductase [Conservatibacter flavescens]|uniref:Glyoxylate/hydroxypyruvate reductase B n=1 Tax=Conservatibacter flavescens TaxID=28161 RepID=A0A2M8S242_9PAST|nr:NAD(P)-dependent oxidoreductase [Conservatibacter flavescens]PJG85220.1 bifunctional glyoxylate/hydroxypyruvate reductase B [Conservatibacter flavescens]